MKPIYQDKQCTAFLAPAPAIPGHIIISPNEQYTILEQVPQEVVGHLFVIANKLSSILFEVMGAQGTNTIIENGEVAGQKDPQVSVHVLPRGQGDGLDFRWEAKGDKSKHEVAEIKLHKALGNKVISAEKKKDTLPLHQKQEPQQASEWIEKALFRLP